MKINPGFLDTLREISDRSQVPLQFCFYMGFAQGLTLDYLRRAIRQVLPTAEVNAHMPVQVYQQALNSCELFVNPFPFGNTNGLVDTVRQGLPGVCMTGPEVHTHIDEGLFRRPCVLQKFLTENDVEKVLFEGQPEKFAARVRELWEARCSRETEGTE
ncbi:putative glycosyl transferase EtpC [Escherichia coli]|nr:putative glycosyl transferase EtpC [Escherichia coli]